MAYDIDSIRAQFPALLEGAAHFDGPGGSQVPQSVADAITATLTSAISNRGRVTPSERRADDIVVAARAAVGDLLGADPRGVVFGRSMTQLTFDFSRTLSKGWAPGDEVVISRLDHDSNVRPWIYAAEAAGATIKWVDFDPQTGNLDASAVAKVLSPQTRLVALTAASNLIGTKPPIAEIAELVHGVGALFYVDGVHFSAHSPVDFVALGADFFVCSPYKFCGPHCGVLVGRPELLEELVPDKLLPSSDIVPERFEFGTLPYELLAGTTAAIDFLAGLVPAEGTRRQRLLASMAVLEAYEDELRVDLEDQLTALDGVTIYSKADERTPTLLFTMEQHTPREIQEHLAAASINAPSGSFYAVEASARLGLGDAGGVRLGLAPYVTAADIERLLTALVDLAGSARS